MPFSNCHNVVQNADPGARVSQFQNLFVLELELLRTVGELQIASSRNFMPSAWGPPEAPVESLTTPLTTLLMVRVLPYHHLQTVVRGAPRGIGKTGGWGAVATRFPAFSPTGKRLFEQYVEPWTLSNCWRTWSCLTPQLINPILCPRSSACCLLYFFI